MDEDRDMDQDREENVYGGRVPQSAREHFTIGDVIWANDPRRYLPTSRRTGLCQSHPVAIFSHSFKAPALGR
jgi:hypothetical protein